MSKGIFGRVKKGIKSGIESAQKSSEKSRERREHIKGIERKERKRQEEKFARFKVQEEYRVKRASTRGSNERGLRPLEVNFDPFAGIFEGPPKPKQKKRKTKRKTCKKKKG